MSVLTLTKASIFKRFCGGVLQLVPVTIGLSVSANPTNVPDLGVGCDRPSGEVSSPNPQNSGASAPESGRQLELIDRVLQMAETIEDSQRQAAIFLDASLSYINLGQIPEATNLLAKALTVADKIGDRQAKFSVLQTIALHYGIAGDVSQAAEVLDRALAMVSDEADLSARASLLTQLALTATQAGQCERASALLAESQAIVSRPPRSREDFPFQVETPVSGSVGFGSAFSTFTETSGTVNLRSALYKQWEEEDINLDGNVFASYDSGRSVNTVRFGGQITSLYRHHFSPRWNFFSTLFASGNDFLFAPATDDEDLSYTVNLVVGAGRNLYRKEDPRQSADWQIGIGARYDYNEIDFEVLDNQVRPVFYTGVQATSLKIGPVAVNQAVIFSIPMDGPEEFNIASRTGLEIPLSKQWSLNGNLTFRYLNQQVLEDNPRFRSTYFVNLNYKF